MSSLETEITNWLVTLIKANSLKSTIESTEQVSQIIDSQNQSSFIPSFTVDYISRLACAKASAYTLSRLSLLEIITVDKSISLKTGEVLRPDIVAFNPETRTLIVFEVKREAITERQAVT